MQAREIGIPVVILAGGQGRRMGGRDKALLPLQGRPLVSHVRDRLAGQARAIALNANGDPRRFAGTGLPVLTDADGGGSGPLSGVLAAIAWAAALGADRVLTVPCDTPFLPPDLVERLARPPGSTPVLATSAGRSHPTVALWPVALADRVRGLLAAGERRLGHALGDAVTVGWPEAVPDPFMNLNTPADLEAAARWLAPSPRDEAP